MDFKENNPFFCFFTKQRMSHPHSLISRRLMYLPLTTFLLTQPTSIFSWSFLSWNKAGASYLACCLFLTDFLIFTEHFLLGNPITIPFARRAMMVLVASESNPKEMWIAFAFPLSCVLGEGEWEISYLEVDEVEGFWLLRFSFLPILGIVTGTQE